MKKLFALGLMGVAANSTGIDVIKPTASTTA